MTQVKKNKARGMTEEEFVLKAIEAGRTDKSKGIHTVYSGFNSAFRKQFPDSDPVTVTTRMAKQGKLVVRFCRGGAMLYKPDEVPVTVDRGEKLLAIMGIN